MIIAWIRVSNDKQNYDRQHYTILEYMNAQGWTVDKTFEYKVSSGEKTLSRLVSELLESLDPKDTIIVDELSRLGRSLRDILNLIHEIRERGLFLVCIKEGIKVLDDELDLVTETLIGAFGLCYMVERKLTRERTREMLAALKAKGVVLGRPKGSFGKSKLDGQEEAIKELLEKKVTKTNIAKIFGVAPSTLVNFIKTRGL